MTHVRSGFKATREHWNLIIAFFEENPDFADGKSYTRAEYKRKWEELSDKLNGLGLGEKSLEKWQKTWTDFKCTLKRKVSLNRKLEEEGSDRKEKLNDLEVTFLEILGDSLIKPRDHAPKVIPTSNFSILGKRKYSNTGIPLNEPPLSIKEEMYKSNEDNQTFEWAEQNPIVDHEDYTIETINNVNSFLENDSISILHRINDTMDQRLNDISHSIDRLADAIRKNSTYNNGIVQAAESIAKSASIISKVTTNLVTALEKNGTPT